MADNAMSKRTPENREKFLEVLGETCSVTAAAQAIGMSRANIYRWRDADADFKTAWEEVKKSLGADSIEDEIVRRGIRGVDEPVFYQGRLAGMWVDADGKEVAPGNEKAVAFKPHFIRKYSDTCLMALANANLPHKYRHRYEHSGPGGGPIPVKDETAPLEIARRVAFILAQGVATQGQGADGRT